MPCAKLVSIAVPLGGGQFFRNSCQDRSPVKPSTSWTERQGKCKVKPNHMPFQQ